MTVINLRHSSTCHGLRFRWFARYCGIVLILTAATTSLFTSRMMMMQEVSQNHQAVLNTLPQLKYDEQERKNEHNQHADIPSKTERHDGATERNARKDDSALLSLPVAPPRRNLAVTAHDTPSADFTDFTNTQGMGACLLIKDDNHWLIEWLAYHWFVMPLRHLIVVVDPDSKTSPRKIFARWKGLMRIDIKEEAHFINKKPPGESMRIEYGNNTQLMHHRHRQATFYTHCLRSLSKESQWVLLTDTDEFVSLDYRGLQKKQNQLSDMAKRFPIQTPGSLLQFLKHHKQVTGNGQKCIYVNRYQVGFKETEANLTERYLQSANKGGSASLNPYNFLTQRFLYQTTTKTSYGKNFMYVAPERRVIPNPNVHRVSLHCPKRKHADRSESTAFFKIQHYLGTPEQYAFRSDPRVVPRLQFIQSGGGSPTYPEHNLESYQIRGRGPSNLDTNVQGWIEGFIQMVGLTKATELLQGIGEVGVE
jgi:Glycosyltransferase family 92